MNYCTETYADALNYSADRFDREQNAICAFLTENYSIMSDANRETILREKRALTLARREQSRRAKAA